MKLGCIPSRHDPRTLPLARYLEPAVLPPAPPDRDWTRAVKQFGMFGNDRLGDCTCAAMGHGLQAQAANVGRTLSITDADVIGLYEQTGYNPADPTTDQGAQLIDVLKLMRSSGLVGEKIGAFVTVDPNELDAAVNLTGFAYVGVALPLSAQEQTVWDVVTGPDAEPGSWGGHAMVMLGYDSQHVIFVTWGNVKIATLAWAHVYMFEAWAAVDELWLRPDGLTPSGFNAKQLRMDLRKLTAG